MARFLYVYTGVHAGARCPAADGMSLGADIQCDIVLSQPSVPAVGGTLRLGEQSWHVDSDTEPFERAWGEILTFHGIDLTVIESTEDEARPPAVGSPPASDALGYASTGAINRRPLVGRASMGLAIALLGVGGWAWGALRAPQDVLTMSAPQATQYAPAIGVAHVPAPSRRPEKSMAAPTEVSPASVAAMLSNFDGRWQAVERSDSVLALQGVYMTEAAWKTAQAALALEYSGLAFDTNGVYSAGHAETTLRARLDAAQLDHVALVWVADQLQVRAPALADGPSITLEREIEAFNARFADVARRTDTYGRDTVHAAMPFAIRGVSRGPTPYLVLPDGSPLLPGGRHGQYRLLDIRPNSIVFDRPITMEVPDLPERLS